MRGENDNTGLREAGPFTASMVALLVPAFAWTILYGLPLAALLISGKEDGAVARLCIVALSAGLPFLIAYAVLRRVTARVDAMPHALILHPGFPSVRQYVVPYRSIQSVKVRQGLGGRLAGSTTLVVELMGGSRRSVADLVDGAAARQAVQDRIAVLGEERESAERPGIAAQSRRMAV